MCMTGKVSSRKSKPWYSVEQMRVWIQLQQMFFYRHHPDHHPVSGCTAGILSVIWEVRAAAPYRTDVCADPAPADGF